MPSETRAMLHFCYIYNILQVQSSARYSMLLVTNTYSTFNSSKYTAGRYSWYNGSFANWWSANTTVEYNLRKTCFQNVFLKLKAGPFLINGENVTVCTTSPMLGKFKLLFSHLEVKCMYLQWLSK